MNFLDVVKANINAKGTINVPAIAKAMNMSFEQVHNELVANGYDLANSNVQAKDGNKGLIWTYEILD